MNPIRRWRGWRLAIRAAVAAVYIAILILAAQLGPGAPARAQAGTGEPPAAHVQERPLLTLAVAGGLLIVGAWYLRGRRGSRG